VYLPWYGQGGYWYSFVDNTMPLLDRIEGGKTIRDFDADIHTRGNHINFIVPLFVKSGAIIPTIEIEQYVGQRNHDGLDNPITLNIYPGDKG